MIKKRISTDSNKTIDEASSLFPMLQNEPIYVLSVHMPHFQRNFKNPTNEWEGRKKKVLINKRKER